MMRAMAKEEVAPGLGAFLTCKTLPLAADSKTKSSTSSPFGDTACARIPKALELHLVKSATPNAGTYLLAAAAAAEMRRLL